MADDMRIRYKGQWWTIRAVAGMHESDGCCGDCDDINALIRYDPSHWPGSTLVHELVHAVRSDDGHCVPIPLSEYTRDEMLAEEKATCSVASAIVAFVADNPHFARWLIDQIDRDSNSPR